MSHTVHPSDLPSTAAPYGRTAFLVYAGASGSARINHVVADLETSDGATIARCRGFGRGVPARVDAGATLSLLWPAPSDEAFSLIADGTGTIDEDVLSIVVTDAVLHRPAPVDGPTTC